MNSPGANLASLASFLPPWLSFARVRDFFESASPFVRSKRALTSDELATLRGDRRQNDTWNISAGRTCVDGESIFASKTVFYRLVELLDTSTKAGVIGFVEELVVTSDFTEGVRSQKRALKVVPYAPFFNAETKALKALANIPNVVPMYNSFFCRSLPSPPPGPWLELVERVERHAQRLRQSIGGQSQGVGFIVLERATFGDLRTFFARQLRVPLTPVENYVALAFQIAHALREIHARSMLHRDLQFGNVLVDTVSLDEVSALGAYRLNSSEFDPYTNQIGSNVEIRGSGDNDSPDAGGRAFLRAMISDFDAAVFVDQKLASSGRFRSKEPSSQIEVRAPEFLFPVLDAASAHLSAPSSQQTDVWAFGVILSSLINYNFLNIFQRRRAQQVVERRAFVAAFADWHRLIVSGRRSVSVALENGGSREYQRSIDARSLNAFTENASPRFAEQMWRVIDIIGFDELSQAFSESPLFSDFLAYAAYRLGQNREIDNSDKRLVAGGLVYEYNRTNRVLSGEIFGSVSRSLQRLLVGCFRADPNRRFDSSQLFAAVADYSLEINAVRLVRPSSSSSSSASIGALIEHVGQCAHCEHPRATYTCTDSQSARRRFCSMHCADASRRRALLHPLCSVCLRSAARFHCGQCRLAPYCSRECQQVAWHWGGHRSMCTQVK